GSDRARRAGRGAGERRLALAKPGAGGGRWGGDDWRGPARRHERAEALRVFLGNKAGREGALPPALVLHQRGEERDVVADALDGEGVERGGLRPAGFGAGRRMGHALGGHWIVVDPDLAPP